MEIIVRLHPESAGALHRDIQTAPEVRAVDRLLARFGFELKPHHPGTSDPELQCFFAITDVPPEKASRIVAALLELRAVESAYVQPPVSPA